VGSGGRISGIWLFHVERLFFRDKKVFSAVKNGRVVVEPPNKITGVAVWPL